MCGDGDVGGLSDVGRQGSSEAPQQDHMGRPWLEGMDAPSQHAGEQAPGPTGCRQMTNDELPQPTMVTAKDSSPSHEAENTLQLPVAGHVRAPRCPPLHQRADSYTSRAPSLRVGPPL